MEEKERFHRWRLKEEDLRDLDAAKARDLIVKSPGLLCQRSRRLLLRPLKNVSFSTAQG
jgi:hypothetical protein